MSGKLPYSKSVGLRLALFVMVWCAVGGLAPAYGADRLAEIVGNDVYVRSGSSLNHYVVTKLQAGDRVTVLSESGEWYEIAPPAGVFSLISGDYVDTADDKTGVVNGANVRVRCGSLLNTSKYTVQTKLSKGAEVEILQRNPDGFLRIAPPDGVTVWINRGLVEIVSEDMASIEREVAETDTGDGAASETKTGDPSVTDSTSEPSDSAEGVDVASSDAQALSALPPTPQRIELSRLDELARGEVAKPIFERRLEPLIKQYGVIAAQTEDTFARRYASVRGDQLRGLASLTETAARMRKLNEQAESARRKALAGRAAMNVVREEPPVALDAQGELRISALYPVGAGVNRYRLVDTSGPRVRTIGYVEIPVGSPIKAELFVGRYVGVRASSHALQPGGVRPVPVFVASELVLLDRPVESSADTD